MNELIIQKIILNNVPSQNFNVILNDQDCDINIYLKGNDYYIDLISNGNPIIFGVKIGYGNLLLNYPFLNTLFNGTLTMLNENNTTIIDYNNFGSITNLYYFYEQQQ